MSKYFTPIDAEGIAIFTQGAESAGWYQLNTPARSLADIGLTPPEGTTGVFIQALADLDFSQSPAQAVADPATAMRLTAKGTMFIPGAEAVQNLCIRLGANGGAFVVQYFTGQIGPLPSGS